MKPDICDVLTRFAGDRSGGVAVEYASIGAGIAVVIATTVFATGDFVVPFYNAVVNAFRSVGF